MLTHLFCVEASKSQWGHLVTHSNFTDISQGFCGFCTYLFSFFSFSFFFIVNEPDIYGQ